MHLLFQCPAEGSNPIELNSSQPFLTRGKKVGGWEVVGVDETAAGGEGEGEVEGGRVEGGSVAASGRLPTTPVKIDGGFDAEQPQSDEEADPLSSSTGEGFSLPEWTKSVLKHTQGKQLPCLNKTWQKNLPPEMKTASLARLAQGLCIKKLVEDKTIHYHRNNGIMVATKDGMVLAACANYQCRLTTKAAKGMQLVNKFSEYIADGSLTNGNGGQDGGHDGKSNGSVTGAGTFTFNYDPTCITWLVLTKEVYDSVKAKGKGTRNNKFLNHANIMPILVLHEPILCRRIRVCLDITTKAL